MTEAIERPRVLYEGYVESTPPGYEERFRAVHVEEKVIVEVLRPDAMGQHRWMPAARRDVGAMLATALVAVTREQ